jgi:hypothetical protein
MEHGRMCIKVPKGLIVPGMIYMKGMKENF